LENLGAHYHIGNTKIATMFTSHRASGKRRRAALGDWTSWSDGGHLGANSEAGRAAGGIEPDVRLIKQVEQVTTPDRRGASPGFRALGGHGRRRNPYIYDLAITTLAVIWLQKQPYRQKKAEGDLW
jgi:hypothetical protein